MAHDQERQKRHNRHEAWHKEHCDRSNQAMIGTPKASRPPTMHMRQESLSTPC